MPTTSPLPDPAAASFADLRRLGWTACASCSGCRRLRDLRLDAVAGLPSDLSPIGALWGEGLLVCATCGEPFAGVAIYGDPTDGGLREIVAAHYLAGEWPDPARRAHR